MTIPLPAALKRRIRPLPQWPPIALREPQDAVQVRLATAHGEFDVTRAAVVAALRPLTFAVGLDPQLLCAIESHSQPQLHFVDLESQRTVAMLQLQHVRNWHTSGASVGLFEVRRATQRCLRWPYRWCWTGPNRFRARSVPRR